MNIYLKKFGTTLVSRPAGKEAWLALQPNLKELEENEKIIIDFKGVAVLTPSWADEVVSPLKDNFQNQISLINTENPSVQATLTTLKKAKQDQKS
ncbi:STAS-like domain-containing protein [Patescibacteria group bacterium]|nr:STAS-like domain-containing protein [Patescibacteria group bacterium]MBU1673987.1 STAS-like domain-containing protein [Patescibacteria group bacterium]MBU1962940.1 STAS-like domain-containing protein [Patescibacteria group bacterium]